VLKGENVGVNDLPDFLQKDNIRKKILRRASFNEII
jgi:hypothetical protein